MKQSTKEARIAISNFVRTQFNKRFPQITEMLYDPKLAQEKYPVWAEYVEQHVDFANILSFRRLHVGPAPANFMVLEAVQVRKDVDSLTQKARTGDFRFVLKEVDPTFEKQIFDIAEFACTCRFGQTHDMLRDDDMATPVVVRSYDETLESSEAYDPQQLHLLQEPGTSDAWTETVYIPFTRKPAGKGLLNILNSLPKSVLWVPTVRHRLPLMSLENAVDVAANLIATNLDPAILNTLGATLENDATIFYSTSHMAQLEPLFRDLVVKHGAFLSCATLLNAAFHEMGGRFDIEAYNQYVRTIFGFDC